MGLALYLIAVIGLVQALFSIFSYVAMPGHPELVPLFRSLSVVFLLVGLLVLGWQCIEPTASIIAQFFMVACIAFSSAEIIFALKGFFMMMIMSRLSPDAWFFANFFNYRDIAIYFVPAFVVLLAAGAIKNLRARGDANGDVPP